MDKKSEIAENLYELRTSKGLNQTAFARILDIQQQTYSMYERGKSEFPIHHLKTLSQYFHLDVNDFIGNHSMTPTYDLNVSFTKNCTLGELVAICMSLKEEDRKSVYDLAVMLNQRS